MHLYRDNKCLLYSRDIAFYTNHSTTLQKKVETKNIRFEDLLQRNAFVALISSKQPYKT